MRLSTRLARVERVMRPQRDPGDEMIRELLQWATDDELRQMEQFLHTMYGPDGEFDNAHVLRDPAASHAAHEYAVLFHSIAERRAAQGATHAD